MIPRSLRARPEAGFLLIGVVMFVLALTILGISLYSLSSYEAEFQGRSRDSNEAFYLGQGGTEMVLKLLQLHWNLDDAQLAVTHQGVDSVYVSQPRPGGGVLTAGPMNDSVATVTVVTSVRGVSRRMVGKYRPARTTSYYTRLFTVGDGGTITQFNPVLGTTPTCVVSTPDSACWTNDADMAAANAWAYRLQWSPRAIHFGGVPVPDVPGFRAEHPGPYDQPVLSFAGLTPTLTFNQGTGSVPEYYGLTTLVPFVGYSVGVLTGLDLVVGGTAIWMLPDGLLSSHNVHIRSPGGPATLVIVGSPQPFRPFDIDYGIYFLGGLDVEPEVNVILVSEGNIALQQDNDLLSHFEARHLSMYCNRLILEGPAVGWTSDLSYDPRMTSVIRSLEQSGDLPGSNAAPPSSFAFVSGSWRDDTP